MKVRCWFLLVLFVIESLPEIHVQSDFIFVFDSSGCPFEYSFQMHSIQNLAICNIHVRRRCILDASVSFEVEECGEDSSLCAWFADIASFFK